jgi:hypothetical protein
MSKTAAHAAVSNAAGVEDEFSTFVAAIAAAISCLRLL